jgi:Calcineurin-like phosphoesterase
VLGRPILTLLTAAIVTSFAAPAPAYAQGKIEAAYVVLGERGAIARAILSNAARCPSIRINGTAQPMDVRAAPESGAEAAFPVLVCERLLPATARSARIGSRRLPLPKAKVQRVAVFGDTGCRLKSWEENGNEGDFQACDDPVKWPFGRLAKIAGGNRPDVVIHVGDYFYRESACPPGDAGCEGSPHGDTWATWKADLFAPAGPLFAAAPWIVVRGNHESCARAGRGYFLFLDPRPADGRQPDCIARMAPYTVTVGGKSVVVIDTADVDDRCSADCNTAPYVAEFAAMKPAPGTWFVTHKPVWAFGKDFTSTRLLQEALRDFGGKLPDGITLALAGHLHVWQALSFADARTPQLVVGDSGSSLDEPPEGPLAGREIGGTTVRYGRVEHRFGFTLLQAAPQGAWTAAFIDTRGRPAFRCVLKPTDVSCP